jgi:hypothetical protein
VSVASSLSLSSLRRGLLRIFFASVCVVVALEGRGWIWGVCVFCGHLMWLDKRFLFKLFLGFLWIYIFDFCLTTRKKKKIACEVFFFPVLLFRDSFLPSFLPSLRVSSFIKFRASVFPGTNLQAVAIVVVQVLFLIFFR